jgi:hypothetical protein
MRKSVDQAPREIAPLGSYDRAVQIRMLELELARANLLEQLAVEIREAKAPRTPLTSSAPTFARRGFWSRAGLPRREPFVDRLAPIIDARCPRLRAVGECRQQPSVSRRLRH